jgi:hypothetical protein
VKLSGNTTVKLATPPSTGGPKTINVKFGDLWAKITRTEEGLVVNTPSSVASVKGTSFWVMVTPNGDTRLLCIEGLVNFLNNISGQQILVSAGQMAFSTMSGLLELSNVNPEAPPTPENVPPSPQPQGGGGTPPEGGPGAPPAPQPTPAPSGGGGGGMLGMNGAVGAATINGINYQYFSLRPDISLWKFGLGLDLAFYFDSDGNLREEDWDQAEDYVDKIYYLRYGKPGEPFYTRVGSLSPITLGYGLIMRRYTNAIEWPQVRRIGMQTELKLGHFKFEGLINNFREIETPGLVGGRLTLETKFILPVVFGGTLVYDGNEFLGAKDSDGDGVPDMWDMFPGKNDEDHIAELWNLFGYDSTVVDQLIDWGDLPNIYEAPQNIEDLTQSVTEWGVDVGIPLIRKQAMNLWIYAQMAKIANYGSGMSVPGVMFNLGPLTASAEYRIFESDFLPDFFDMAYETERVVWNPNSVDYITKIETLKGLSSAQGYFAELEFNVFNLFTIVGAYQNMSYGGGVPGQSIYCNAVLNTKSIPKLSLAEAYFQQPNADKIFSRESNGTVLGYRIGFEVGGGVSLIYDNKTIYYNGEPNRITTIETAITFK